MSLLLSVKVFLLLCCLYSFSSIIFVFRVLHICKCYSKTSAHMSYISLVSTLLISRIYHYTLICPMFMIMLLYLSIYIIRMYITYIYFSCFYVGHILCTALLNTVQCLHCTLRKSAIKIVTINK